VEKPALHLPWEYHLSRVLERRLREQGLAENLQCFVRPASLQLYRDGCSMLMACEQRGTLQDLINVYQRAGLKLSEELLMHHTAQMLRAVEALHAAGVLHGDIKPDNWLLKGREGGRAAGGGGAGGAGKGKGKGKGKLNGKGKGKEKGVAKGKAKGVKVEAESESESESGSRSGGTGSDDRAAGGEGAAQASRAFGTLGGSVVGGALGGGALGGGGGGAVPADNGGSGGSGGSNDCNGPGSSLLLVDFGRAIDLRMYPRGAQFVGAVQVVG
jgi:serine/threonine protein kinase